MAEINMKLEEKATEIQSLKESQAKHEEDIDRSQTEADKLKQCLQEKELEMKQLATVNDGLTAEVTSVKKMNTDLTSELTRLRSVSLNTSGGQDLDDSRSEVMSTSTVSRAEEFNRMKDVEDSFEERYSKLKLIAIKLKKKVADQDKTIKELQSKAGADGDNNSAGLRDKVTTLNKNFNILQSQYDEAIDKLDNSNKEIKTLKKDLEQSINDHMDVKKQNEESVQETSRTKAELAKAEEQARDAESKCRSLEVTLEEERKERKALEISCETNSDLSTKLKDKINENTLIEETTKTLKLQITQLEETLNNERDRAEAAHNNLTSTRNQLTSTEAELSRLRAEAGEFNIKYEKSVQQSEDLQAQLVESIQERDKSGSEKKNRISQLERQVSVLETSLHNKTETLGCKEQELMTVSKEFEQYKLRAQSVLKQTKEIVQDEESRKRQEDIFALEKMNDALNDKLKTFSTELKTLSIERNSVQEEHDRLMGQHSALLQELAAKEKSFRETLDQKNKDIERGEVDKTSNIERIQKTMESLKQSHNHELELLRTHDKAEMDRLKQQLDMTENEVIRLELVLAKEQEARKVAEEMSLVKIDSSNNRFDSKLDIREIEREACEGQEVDIPGVNNNVTNITSPVPLDQLLAHADLPGNNNNTALIIKYYLLSHTTLHCSIVSVTIVSQPRDNVFILVEMRVHGSSEDADLGVVLGHGSQTLRTTDEVEKQDVLWLHTLLLKHDTDH